MYPSLLLQFRFELMLFFLVFTFPFHKGWLVPSILPELCIEEKRYIENFRKNSSILHRDLHIF